MIAPFLALMGAGSDALAAPEPLAAPPAEEARAEAEDLRREMEQLRREVAQLREQAGRESNAEPGNRSEEDGDGARSRTAFGQGVRVGPGEEAEEAVSFGGDVEVAGRVLGDAVSFGGNVVVRPTGLVAGDAVSFGGRVVVEEGGAVDGDRVAMGLPAVAPGSAPPAAEQPTSLAVADLGPVTGLTELVRGLYRRLVWALWVAGAGVLVVGLFPGRVSRVAADIEARPVRAAVVGTLGSSFLLLFSLLFTLVTLGLGLPVGLLLVGVLGFAWLFGFVGLCQAVGDHLPLRERPHGRWVAFLVGVLLVTFLGSLPWVGWLVVVSASAVGVGSALATRFGRA